MKNKLLKLTIVSLGLGVFLGVSNSAWLSPALTATQSSLTASVAPEQGRNEVTVELNTNGFSPTEVQHAPGSFAIAVDNKAIDGEYTLRLSAQDGTVLHELHVQKGSGALSVSLQTGSYTLTEVNHLQWTCHIVVQ